jgi:hypothetical protein
VRDHPFAELPQAALRERGLILTEAVEHHLPAIAIDAAFHCFAIGHGVVVLQEQHLAHHRRCLWRCARASIAIHRRQRILEFVVENLVTMQTQERVQLAMRFQPSEHALLCLRRLHRRAPSFDCHASLHRGGDQQNSAPSIPVGRIRT